MVKQIILKPEEADKALKKAVFIVTHSKGSHRIYMKNNIRVVVPFHSGKDLHPKVVKQISEAIRKSED